MTGTIVDVVFEPAVTVTVASVVLPGKCTKFTVIVLHEMEMLASLALAGPAHNTRTPDTILTTPAMAAMTLALALRTTPPFHSRLHELTVAARWCPKGEPSGQGDLLGREPSECRGLP